MLRPSCADLRGVTANRHETWVRMRWTQEHRRTCDAFADDEIVWFWRPWAGAKSASDDLANDGDYNVTDTGKSANISVNTIAQGMSLVRLHLW